MPGGALRFLLEYPRLRLTAFPVGKPRVPMALLVTRMLTTRPANRYCTSETLGCLAR